MSMKLTGRKTSRFREKDIELLHTACVIYFFIICLRYNMYLEYLIFSSSFNYAFHNKGYLQISEVFFRKCETSSTRIYKLHKTKSLINNINIYIKRKCENASEIANYITIFLTIYNDEQLIEWICEFSTKKRTNLVNVNQLLITHHTITIS